MTVTRVLHHVGGEALEATRAAFPQVEFVRVPVEGPLGVEIYGDVLLTTAIGGPNLPEVLGRGVRWVHTIGTGVDRFPLHEIRPGQVLTCSRGASAIPIAEWVLAVMLAFEKQIPDIWVDRAPEHWFRVPGGGTLGGLHKRRLAILGLGSIGLEVARRALGFGMEVRGLRRTPRPVDLPGVEVVSDARKAVEGARTIVVAAPATPETHHLVDAALLECVQPGVHLVNVSRGSLIDQEALRVALDDGRVARATLDVTDPEPLPSDHWLYRHPSVRLSPHLSWSMPESNDFLYETFRANLTRWLEGRPLEGVVDIEAGY
ncbi:MAG TPA: NAD(P)-dependent oxidoreductase [Acidimicrobiales bacterium]